MAEGTAEASAEAAAEAAAATAAAAAESAEAAAEAGSSPQGDDDVEKWKSLSRKMEREKKQAQRELEELRKQSMSEQEKAVADARAEGRAEALKTANERLLKAEVRALAAGVLADPNDAIHLLDLSGYDPDDDGDFDRKAIKADLQKLVAAKPYLSPSPGHGAGEGGARGGQATPSKDPLVTEIERMVGGRSR